jgi:hypothetical protein
MNEIEQRHVIRVLSVKTFALDRIMAEITSVYREQTDAKKAVECWIRQVKLGRSDIKEEAKMWIEQLPEGSMISRAPK